jgi:hypothetical protein
MKTYIGSSSKRPEQSHLFLQSQHKQNPRDRAAPDPVVLYRCNGLTESKLPPYPSAPAEYQRISIQDISLYMTLGKFLCYFTILLYVYIHTYVFLIHVQAELFISGEEFLRF